MTIYEGKGTLFDHHGRALGTVTDLEVTTVLVNESDAHLFKDVLGVNVEVYKGPATTVNGGGHDLRGKLLTVGKTTFAADRDMRNYRKVRKVAQWKRERR